MVLHVQRVDGFWKQETIRVAEIFDSGIWQPSWKMFVDILKIEDQFGIGFVQKESDVLLIENQIVVGNDRQLLACLQYLCNVNKVNALCLVYHRTTVGHITNPVLERGRKIRDVVVHWRRRESQSGEN